MKKVSAKGRKRTLVRVVFNRRNSTCATSRIADLSAYNWQIDIKNLPGFELRACRWKDVTYPVVTPRPIPGYTCRRLQMGIRLRGPILFWEYEANDDDRPAKGRTP
jgi:hypothetical protein